MTTDLPDPHACPHRGSPRFDSCDGVVQCASCNAPRATATPGCPVRNAMADRIVQNEDGGTDAYYFGKTPGRFAMVRTDVDGSAILFADRDGGISRVEEVVEGRMEELARRFADSVAEETARERKVHGGGPRVVG